MASVDFSIIVPVLNEEKLLPAFLRNVKEVVAGGEHYRSELIIADGGSCDSSLGIVAQQADIVLDLSGKTVNNIASGRNAGAKEARGDLLIFCNADVIFDEPARFLERLDTEFKEDEEMVALAAWVETFPEEEKLADKLFHSFYNHYFRLLNQLGVGMGRGECIVVRKKSFFEAGGFDEAFPAGEDFELFNKLIRLGRVKYSKAVKVFESPRRFREYGYLKVTALWTVNATSVYFRKRSVSTKWKQVR